MLMIVCLLLNWVSVNADQQQITVLFHNAITFLDGSTVWIDTTTLSCTTSVIETTLDTQITTILSTTTTATTGSLSSNEYTCSDGSYGVYCNISSNVCYIAYPCQNGGTCSVDTSLSAGYSCQCVIGFAGYDCETDERDCTTNTCWNNGTCIEINQTMAVSNSDSFQCQCVSGYDGVNCESYVDMCSNVTCENQGICVSSYLSWACQCLDSSLYTGTYCQEKSASLEVKEIVSLTFAIIAIVALCIVGIFVVAMDLLKYVFKIDPIDRELHRLKMEQEKEEQKRFRKRRRKANKKNLYYLFSYIE